MLNGEEGFLGLGDAELEALFKWSDGSYPTWTNWYIYRPATVNDGNNLDCVKILASGEWVDVECSITLPYVCKLQGGL